ncbi:conserved hypothetical protein [Histoplasma capsulatum G186AR]|uniref:Vacuolar import and degradation protein n=1 Tax=Ajellomyces capsulatus (strain G186AR / H82 / ATCC MYA-2454 / RMSCC 2432) TaxID=447093 RepID=C0NUE7_AJECG|nr:uncharacterized protein HCBG_06978 [Histoplasma capsulatum G186AR]EEH05027.1 conserved hypothetical protein [Histoplasma capsulatum G186AR]
MSLPEDEVNADNIRFLRSRRRSSPDSSPGRVRSRRRHLQSLQDEVNSGMDSNDQRRPSVTVGVSRRIPIVRRRDPMNGVPNYETRSRPSNPAYAWVPGSDYEEEEDASVGATNLIQEMWDGRLLRARHTALGSRGERREGSATSPRLWARDPNGESIQPSRYGRSDLATATLLQTVRRHPRFSSRTRTLQTYILDRDRGGRESEERDWQPSSTTPTTTASSTTSPPPRSSTTNHGDIMRNTGASEPRDMYFEDRSSVDRFEETIKYLDRVRFAKSYDESVQFATAGDFIQYEYLRRNEDDFILDTSSIGSPADSSWLKPGTVFEGSQHATNYCSTSAMFQNRRPRSHQIDDPIVINGTELGRTVYTSAGRRSYQADIPHEFGDGTQMGMNSNSRHEHWPVKVTIHSVDYNTMTLSGTMEAYNIPDKTSNSQGAHITTFLEGEIIDFNTHSLETKNFKANAEIDSLYWRELEPFKDLSYDEIVRNLVSLEPVHALLNIRMVSLNPLTPLERCFITPSHSRQGLTISGFYYISVRREDGHIEGMYYDPGSSPYQHLSLMPHMREKMVFPAYNFR